MIFPSQSQCLERLWTSWNMKSDVDGRQSLCGMNFLWSCSPLLGKSKALKCVNGFLLFLFFQFKPTVFELMGTFQIVKAMMENGQSQNTYLKINWYSCSLLILLYPKEVLSHLNMNSSWIAVCIVKQSPELQVTIIFISKFVSKS